jgi:hypothetical protein
MIREMKPMNTAGARGNSRHNLTAEDRYHRALFRCDGSGRDRAFAMNDPSETKHWNDKGRKLKK